VLSITAHRVSSASPPVNNSLTVWLLITRYDYINYEKKQIVDIKTTSSYINYNKLNEICFGYDYDLSAALYLDALEVDDIHNWEFIYVFLSKKDGKVGVYSSSLDFIENGRKKYKKAIQVYKQCLSTGHYPFQQFTVPAEYRFKGE
jgi:hypothetical protein